MVSVQRRFLFLLVLRIGYFSLLWHSLGLPYNYFENDLATPKPNYESIDYN